MAGALPLERTSATRLVAAIDVGTNAVRLEIARAEADGSLRTLHQERDAIRPGDGVFRTGVVPRAAADRLLATLRRYATRCRREGAVVRAVATSALREARNGGALVRRARGEAGLDLEVLTGAEEARLMCLGALRGKRASARSLVLDIGGGSSEVAIARGERPTGMWSVALGAVRVTETFEIAGEVSAARLDVIRSAAAEELRAALPAGLSAPRRALGSSGTIHAVVSFACGKRARRASRRDVERAVDALAAMSSAERRRHFDARRAEIVLAGAVILEAALRHLGARSVEAVDAGLRAGVLAELARQPAAITRASRGAPPAPSPGRRRRRPAPAPGPPRSSG